MENKLVLRTFGAESSDERIFPDFDIDAPAVKIVAKRFSFCFQIHGPARNFHAEHRPHRHVHGVKPVYDNP